MTSLDAIILGIIQGFTEFFPVSSSGHLKLAQYLLGFRNLEDFILFDLICHFGTLFALFLGFKKEIQQLLITQREKLINVLLATLPLFPLVLFLKPIKRLFNQIEYLGFFFLFTALFLYIGIRLSRKQSSHTQSKKDAVIIGISQAAAILPGISRSGSTISTARILGWSLKEAVVFSFMLAIPAVLGGICLEILQLFNSQQLTSSITFSHYLLAFCTSFITGSFAITILMKLAAKDKFIYFVWYCLVLGILTSLYFNI